MPETTRWKPTVGMRCTYSPYTDMYPCTVVEVSPSGHQIILRRDREVCVDPDIQPGGFAPVHGPRQKWKVIEDPDGVRFKATRRRDGRYRRVGDHYSGCRAIMFGKWEYYRDPNF